MQIDVGMSPRLDKGDMGDQNKSQEGYPWPLVVNIEDVERGAELSFSGRRPLCGPLHHRQILFSNDQILVSDRQTDGRMDGRTDAINIFWAFLVKN